MVTNGTCLWHKPEINLISLVVVSLFNALISIPIETTMDFITQSVLLAPTLNEVKTDMEETRRQLEIFERNRTASAPLDLDGIREDEDPHAFHVSSITGDQFHRHRRAAALVLHTSTLASSQQEQIPSSGAATESATAADAAESPTNDASKAEREKILRSLSRHAAGLGEEERAQLQSRWPSLENCNTDPKWGLVESELANVIEESTKSIERMKSLSEASRGEMLLQLFVLDLIGRKSRQGKIFSNQIEGKSAIVVTWGVKSLVVAGIILMNLYFVLTCMLYGRAHGKSLIDSSSMCLRDYIIQLCRWLDYNWQFRWLMIGVVNITLDVFITKGIHWF